MRFVELFLVLASAPYFFWFSLPQNRMPRNPILDLACQSDNLDKGTLGPEMFLHVFDFFSGACCSAGSGPAGAFDGLWHPKAEQIQSATSKTLGSVCFTWKVKETPMKMERKNPQDVTCFRLLLRRLLLHMPWPQSPRWAFDCVASKNPASQLRKPKLG